uniref:low affinity immunoglobulin gamma Fc region receptor III-A-like n=1 Tax=Semicossyphus pulcher TaxID=241346 RepID=UPI0037E87FED
MEQVVTLDEIEELVRELSHTGRDPFTPTLHFSLILRQQQDNMMVAALLIKLLLMQPGAHFLTVDAAFWIIPTRQQLFEYESLSFKCTGFDSLTGWNVSRKTKADISTCGFSKWGVSTKSSCTIRGAFLEDSGVYWCEAGGGKRSNSVNITVSAGSVILESPVHPVMEGETVTLRCRNKTTSSIFTAYFYKDGRLIGSGSTKGLKIHSVSLCDEGLYKCRIINESPESWLAVRAQRQETQPSSDLLFVVLRNILPVVMMALLLLLLGLLHGWRLTG